MAGCAQVFLTAFTLQQDDIYLEPIYIRTHIPSKKTRLYYVYVPHDRTYRPILQEFEDLEKLIRDAPA